MQSSCIKQRTHVAASYGKEKITLFKQEEEEIIKRYTPKDIKDSQMHDGSDQEL